ncbi:MAG TPA: helix-turn-helix domain-containing protein [Solirubrobacterales bacterium]|jgi:GAF domain-containing protein/sugar diacid utilization regulator|nr:helix-turn-helix domain-containing protein [Solirubrobacterales bacterium]
MARPTAHPGEGLSDTLAFLELRGTDTVGLASLISAEALRLFGGGEAVVWVHRPDLGRLFCERSGSEPASVAVSEAEVDLLARGGVAWEPGSGDVRARLIEASFGLVAEQRSAGVLGVPLSRGEALQGMLLIAGEEPLLGTTREERLAGFARQVAVLLSNHAQLQRAESNERQLQALFETASELSSNLDLETALTAIVERVQVVAKAPVSYIMLVDEEAGEIAMRVTLGTEHPGFSGLRLKLGGGLGGRVAARGRPFYTSAYLDDERFEHDPEVDAAVRHEGIRSILGAPMSVGQRFVGVLFVADRAVRVFSEAEVGLVSSLASHAATAIRNANLYDRARSAFADLARSNAVVKTQNMRLQRAEALHARLSGAVLEGQGLADVVELTAEVTGGQLLAFDRHHQPIADAGAPGDPFGRRLLRAGAAEVSKQLPRPLTDGDGTTVCLEPDGASRQQTWLVAPIVAGAVPLGSLWLGIGSAEVHDARPLFDQATRVVALELLKDRAVAEVHRRLGRELLDDLLAGHARVDDGTAKRAAEMGVDLGQPHRLVRINLLAQRAAGGTADLGHLPDALLTALRRQPWCRFAARYSQAVVAVVDGETPDLVEQVRTTLAPVAEPGERLKAAITPPCGRLEDYRRFFLAAGRVLALLRGDPGTSVVDLGDAWVLSLVFGGEDDGGMASFVEAQLGQLLLHDEQHGLSLLETLDAYLQADLSATRTAAALHVHVNTVYYRLQRLRELLGETFTEPRRALDLRIALLAHQTLSQ